LEAIFWILTLGGIGYLSIGGILALPLGLLWMYILHRRTRYWLWILVAQIILALVLVTLASPFETEDPGAIVIDEFIATGILLIATRDRFTLIVGLVLYGVLDGIKPLGQYAELIPGALGIVGDDVVSAILASLCLFLVSQLFIRYRHAQGESEIED